MSVARTVVSRPTASRHASLRLDAPRLLLLAANLVGGLCVVASLFDWWGLSSRALLDGVSFEALIVLATVLFFLSALAQPSKWRRPWLLVSAGLFAVLLGSLSTATYEITLGYVPSPSLADVFFLAFYPLLVAGLLQFPKAVTTRAEAVGFALDAVAVLFGSGMVVAYTLIIPTFQSADEALPSLIASAALPLGDVLLVFGLISLVVRRRSLPRDASIGALAAALLLLLAADFLYSFQTIGGGEPSQAVQGSLGALSWILVSWAGYARLRKKAEDGPDREIEIPSLFAYLVAYVAATAGFGVLLLAAADLIGTSLGLMILAAVAVTPLLLARQVLALRESGTLHELKGSQETEERFRSLVTNSSDTIFVTDEKTAILYATPSAHSVLGYEGDDLRAHSLSELVHPDDLNHMLSLLDHCAANLGRSARGEWRMRDSEGVWHFTETVVANLLDDPHVHGFVFTSRDIGERIRFQNELQHQAFHDALTGLANRVLFKDRVEHALASAARKGVDVAVLFMDIDDFKLVNDSYGHVLGDNLLVQVAERLRGILRASDTAARLGGDEFAILLEGETDLDEACRVAQRVLDLYDKSFALDTTRLSVSVSIGVAVSDGSHMSAEELLRDADVAMYSAKAHGKDRIEVFEPAMQTAVYERLELANELRRAVERREFVVFYQPIVEISTQRIVGTEALVRWEHPREGLKLPGWFIEVAEDTGLIVPIGDFVLYQACRQLREWTDRFTEAPLCMAVNLSPRQIKDPLLVDKVREALASTGIDPACLTLEITETALVEDSYSTLARLRELKALGIRLSIDDFGTGYSSLSYLRQFPVDGVKIAKPFVDHVADGEDHSALARAIITIGETLQLEVVAEG
ncbi:MAG TPA: EAL domain-containing protein, partial [Thermoleophilia bacterium]|nr:EAL domain-containing protein [Thermoleophilia bacterium]